MPTVNTVYLSEDALGHVRACVRFTQACLKAGPYRSAHATKELRDLFYATWLSVAGGVEQLNEPEIDMLARDLLLAESREVPTLEEQWDDDQEGGEGDE